MTRGEIGRIVSIRFFETRFFQRIGQLLEFLQDKTQTFVTTSKESFIEKFGGGAKVFTVTNGATSNDKTFQHS